MANKMVIVNDNNDIDREVTSYKPDTVIIEALWVTPEKFGVLTKLHPNVKWVVRLHSEIPFLAMEGISIEWIKKYYKYTNVHVASNSLRACADLRCLIGEEVFYLPNYYPIDDSVVRPFRTNFTEHNIINISCFGAIRPFKNQISQAIAAIKVAERLHRKLKFHINATRIEQNGNSIYKNLVSLFADSKHELVEWDWLRHELFLNVVRNNIDVGMQVSFSETYNIVAADHINMNIPVVSSDEIGFVSSIFKANPTDLKDIEDKLYRTVLLMGDEINSWNKILLQKQNETCIAAWGCI
jgi:hypothetical protein